MQVLSRPKLGSGHYGWTVWPLPLKQSNSDTFCSTPNDSLGVEQKVSELLWFNGSGIGSILCSLGAEQKVFELLWFNEN